MKWSTEVRRSVIDRRGGVRLGAAVALGTGAAGAGVALLATSGWLIVRAAEHPPVLALMVAIVAVRAFGLGRAVLRYAERLVAHDAALRVLARLRMVVYARLAASGTAVLGRRRIGDLASTVVADVDAVLDLLLRAVLPAAVSLLVAAGAVAAVAAFLPTAAWWLAAAVVIVSVGVLAAALRGRRAPASVAGERALLADAVTELLHGLPDLVANNAADSRAVETAGERLRRAEARGAWSVGVGRAVVVLATGLACCAAVVTGVAALREGRLDAVHLAVVALVPLALADVLTVLPDAAHHTLLARAALRRLAALPALPALPAVPEQPRGVLAAAMTTPTTPRGTPPAALRLDRLRVRWAPDRPYVLDGVTLDAVAGQRIAVVGASGSGKSTLAAAILGEVPLAAGAVYAAGGVGLCGQDAYVFDSTVAENVRLARPDASDAEVREALTTAGLGDRLAALPDGLDTRVGEHGDRLSGGERQRLALARVLLADPAVVVLDEPVEHLDEPTADAVMRDVLAATEGRTVLLLTHRAADLAHMDQVWRLDAGRLHRLHRCEPYAIATSSADTLRAAVRTMGASRSMSSR